MTGYLIGIQELDAIARSKLVPQIQELIAAGTPIAPHHMSEWWHARHFTALPAGIRVKSLAWSPNPAYSLTWSTSMPDSALLSRRYEFAASHRLHCPELSDADNQRVFGKCNSANGHGHNYRLQVAVRTPVRGASAPPSVAALDSAVEASVLRRMDHKHLNQDVPEFQRLNPSVENIAAICHALLAEPVRAAGFQLERVTVWETEKTCATYPAE